MLSVHPTRLLGWLPRTKVSSTDMLLRRTWLMPPLARAMVLARLRSLFRSWKEVRDLTRESPERLQALIKQNEAAAAASEQRLANMQQSLARPLEQVGAARSSEFIVAKRQGNPTGLFVERCPASMGRSRPYTVTRAHAAHSHTHITRRGGLCAAGDGLTRHPNPDPDRSRRSRPDPDRSRGAALTLTP